MGDVSDSGMSCSRETGRLELLDDSLRTRLVRVRFEALVIVPATLLVG